MASAFTHSQLWMDAGTMLCWERLIGYFSLLGLGSVKYKARQQGNQWQY